MAFFSKRLGTTESQGGEYGPRPIQIRSEDGWIRGRLEGPRAADGLLVVAGWENADDPFLFDLKEMHIAGFATLKLDLVRRSEKEYELVRFDIPRLARRLSAAAAWLGEEPSLPAGPTGFLCSGNAAAAALWSTQKLGTRPDAIVSVNGRPHLAEPLVGKVSCPTLLLVSKSHPRLLHMNHLAAQRLNGASRLVELEPLEHQPDGSAASAAREVAGWFRKHFAESSRSRRHLALTGLLSIQLKRLMIALAAFGTTLLAVSEGANPETGRVTDQTAVERDGRSPES